MSTSIQRLLRVGIAILCIASAGLAGIWAHAAPTPLTLQKKASSLKSELNDLNNQLNSLVAQMDDLSLEAETLAADMDETKAQMDGAQQAGEAQYQAMKLRIKYIYEAGNASFLELLFSAENMADFLNKSDFVQAVNEYDRNMLNELLDTQKQITKHSKKLQEQHESLIAKQAELSSKRAEVEQMIADTSAELATYSAQLERARQAELLASKQAAEEAAKQQNQAAQAPPDTSGTAPAAPAPSDPSGMRSLGSFKITHYCSCYICCGSWSGGPTASGAMPTAGRTIAVDPSVIPLGSRVVINGQTYVAEDTGGAIKGNKIDIFVGSDHSLTLQLGVYYADVYVAN